MPKDRDDKKCLSEGERKKSDGLHLPTYITRRATVRRRRSFLAARRE